MVYVDLPHVDVRDLYAKITHRRGIPICTGLFGSASRLCLLAIGAAPGQRLKTFVSGTATRLLYTIIPESEPEARNRRSYLIPQVYGIMV